MPRTKKKTKVHGINERFKVLERCVELISTTNRMNSIILTGPGGLGKTYTVRKQLEKIGLKENEDFFFFTGKSTIKGLYETLYDRNGKILIFDDCDNIFKESDGINLLKGALNSDKREVVWNKSTERGGGDRIPPRFEFTGKIFIISNQRREKMDQALLTRTYNIDLSMSLKDKLERMDVIYPAICKEYELDPNEGKYCYKLIQLASKEVEEDKINLRNLVQTMQVYSGLKQAILKKDNEEKEALAEAEEMEFEKREVLTEAEKMEIEVEVKTMFDIMVLN